jgi:hypothetical protein
MIQKWEEKYERIPFHLYIVGHQAHVFFACLELQIKQTAFLRVPTCGNLLTPIRASSRLVRVRSAGDEQHRRDDSKHDAQAIHDHLKGYVGTDRLVISTDLKEQGVSDLMRTHPPRRKGLHSKIARLTRLSAKRKKGVKKRVKRSGLQGDSSFVAETLKHGNNASNCGPHLLWITL